MKQLTAGSLFSGIGGIDLAFALAGFNILFQVEIDDFCRKVLKKHGPTYWPDAEIHTDVRRVGRYNLPEVDVLFGGFPCQSVSDAGKREGIHAGTKSGLWFEFERIIGEIRPRIVFLENVSAITVKGRGGVEVITGLTQMGYDCKWGIVSAADAGAPHQRDRWFCVGDANILRHTESYATSEFHRDQEWHDSESGSGGLHVIHASLGNGEMEHSHKEHRASISGVSVGGKKGFASGGYGAIGPQTKRTQHQPGMGRAAHGVSRRMDGHQLMMHRWPAPPNQPQNMGEPSRMAPVNEYTVDRIRALGNAVVPQDVYPMAVQIAELLRLR